MRSLCCPKYSRPASSLPPKVNTLAWDKFRGYPDSTNVSCWPKSNDVSMMKKWFQRSHRSLFSMNKNNFLPIFLTFANFNAAYAIAEIVKHMECIYSVKYFQR